MNLCHATLLAFLLLALFTSLPASSATHGLADSSPLRGRLSFDSFQLIPRRIFSEAVRITAPRTQESGLLGG